MGVDEEGKLVPMSALKGNPLSEEAKSDSENDGETHERDEDWFQFIHSFSLSILLSKFHLNYFTCKG